MTTGLEIVWFLCLLVGWVALQIAVARKLGVVQMVERTVGMQRVPATVIVLVVISVPLHALLILVLVIAAAAHLL